MILSALVLLIFPEITQAAWENPLEHFDAGDGAEIHSLYYCGSESWFSTSFTASTNYDCPSVELYIRDVANAGVGYFGEPLIVELYSDNDWQHHCLR